MMARFSSRTFYRTKFFSFTRPIVWKCCHGWNWMCLFVIAIAIHLLLLATLVDQQIESKLLIKMSLMQKRTGFHGNRTTGDNRNGILGKIGEPQPLKIEVMPHLFEPKMNVSFTKEKTVNTFEFKKLSTIESLDSWQDESRQNLRTYKEIPKPWDFKSGNKLLLQPSSRTRKHRLKFQNISDPRKNYFVDQSHSKRSNHGHYPASNNKEKNVKKKAKVEKDIGQILSEEFLIRVP